MPKFDKEKGLYTFDCGCKFKTYGDIKENDGIPKLQIDYDNINYACPYTWDIFFSGDTLGVFQLENGLGQRWSKEAQPKSIDEVSDVISIIRPGVLEAFSEDENGNAKSMTQWYVDRKHGRAKMNALYIKSNT